MGINILFTERQFSFVCGLVSQERNRLQELQRSDSDFCNKEIEREIDFVYDVLDVLAAAENAAMCGL